MSETPKFIRCLEALQEGERSRLRSLAGQPLDATLQGFDLFTGLWWPLRKKSQAVPRREPSWLVAKLYGSFRLSHVQDGERLPAILGRCEPRDPRGRRRFRTRFDALLCSPLSALEPHLRWALGEAARAVAGHRPHVQRAGGLDWVRLLDDLAIWDRGEEHRRKRDVCDEWAEAYLSATRTN